MTLASRDKWKIHLSHKKCPYRFLLYGEHGCSHSGRTDDESVGDTKLCLEPQCPINAENFTPLCRPAQDSKQDQIDKLKQQSSKAVAKGEVQKSIRLFNKAWEWKEKSR